MTEIPDDDAVVGASAEHDEVVAKLAELITLRKALHFPDGSKKFNLKSGRQTAYFLDIAALCAGHDMFEVGKAYGVTIRHHFDEEVDVLFAPGYSGIPSTVTATHYYSLLTGHQTEWAYARHAADPYALRPLVAGAQLNEDRRVVIVDDILTTGASLREAIATVRATGAKVIGACVMVDRRERGKGNRLASADIKRDTGVPVVSCARIDELVLRLPESLLSVEQRESIAKSAKGA